MAVAMHGQCRKPPQSSSFRHVQPKSKGETGRSDGLVLLSLLPFLPSMFDVRSRGYPCRGAQASLFEALDILGLGICYQPVADETTLGSRGQTLLLPAENA